MGGRERESHLKIDEDVSLKKKGACEISVVLRGRTFFLASLVRLLFLTFASEKFPFLILSFSQQQTRHIKLSSLFLFVF